MELYAETRAMSQPDSLAFGPRLTVPAVGAQSSLLASG